MSSDPWMQLRASLGSNRHLVATTVFSNGLSNDTLVRRLGLSAPFFKQGWGDLGVVSFEEAESLLKGWPPEHFDTKVGAFPIFRSQDPA